MSPETLNRLQRDINVEIRLVKNGDHIVVWMTGTRENLIKKENIRKVGQTFNPTTSVWIESASGSVPDLGWHGGPGREESAYRVALACALATAASIHDDQRSEGQDHTVLLQLHKACRVWV